MTIIEQKSRPAANALYVAVAPIYVAVAPRYVAVAPRYVAVPQAFMAAVTTYNVVHRSTNKKYC